MNKTKPIYEKVKMDLFIFSYAHLYLGRAYSNQNEIPPGPT